MKSASRYICAVALNIMFDSGYFLQTSRTCAICCINLVAMVAGGHTLSGAVLEPTALQELFPDWKDRGVCYCGTCNITQLVTI